MSPPRRPGRRRWLAFAALCAACLAQAGPTGPRAGPAGGVLNVQSAPSAPARPSLQPFVVSLSTLNGDSYVNGVNGQGAYSYVNRRGKRRSQPTADAPGSALPRS